MSVDQGPTLRRRRLGAELQRCRESSGLTQEDVSRHFEWHPAKVNRIETARVPASPRDVKDMLTLYDVQDQQYRDTLVDLARTSRGRAWWSGYRDIMRPGNYVGLEAEASTMRTWEPIVISGLLQTEAYMRAIIPVSVPPNRPQEIDRRVSLRLARQRRLTGDPKLHLTAIIDESVVHRVIGAPNVMTEQLQHLIEKSTLPNVTLLILPYSAGEHPLLNSPVTLLEFPETPHLDVVYMEGLDGSDHYKKRPDDVARYRTELDLLTTRALDPQHTVKFINKVLSSAGT
jgi:uncharacterized protein DUF5753/helix-turn-helix protein